MNLRQFNADVRVMLKAHQVKSGWSDSLPAKLAGLMGSYIGERDGKFVAHTGSAYLYCHGLKIRIADHPIGRDHIADINVRIGKEGCVEFAAQECLAAMRILEGRVKSRASMWEDIKPRSRVHG